MAPGREELGHVGHVYFTVIMIEVLVKGHGQEELIRPLIRLIMMIMDKTMVILIMIITRGQAVGSLCQCQTRD